MTVKLNDAGKAHAASMIRAGKVDKTTDWTFDAAAGDALLGDKGDDWAAYSEAHLGIDTGEAPNTKGRFKYPFQKGDKVYRSGLIAIRQRAKQQGADAIFDAAGALVEAIDKDEKAAPQLGVERRAFAVSELRVVRAEGAGAMICGHAAVFGSLSEDLGGFREQIAPGAFSQAISEDDVRALFNHDPNFILGRNRSKTLRMKEDTRGLAMEIDAPDTQTIRDLVLAPIERGDVSQMSFGFAVRGANGDDWQKDETGQVIRTLRSVRLYDVSPVVFPAYPQTDVAMRGLLAWQGRQAPPQHSALLRAMALNAGL